MRVTSYIWWVGCDWTNRLTKKGKDALVEIACEFLLQPQPESESDRQSEVEDETVIFFTLFLFFTFSRSRLNFKYLFIGG